MVAKRISMDDFSENCVGRWSNNYKSGEHMNCLGRFSNTFASEGSLILLPKFGSASVSESVRTRDMGWAFRHSSRITNLLECVFTLDHCICT